MGPAAAGLAADSRVVEVTVRANWAAAATLPVVMGTEGSEMAAAAATAPAARGRWGAEAVKAPGLWLCLQPPIMLWIDKPAGVGGVDVGVVDGGKLRRGEGRYGRE